MLSQARPAMISSKKRTPKDHISPPYAFPRSDFVRYTFLVLPVHFLIGFLICYAILYYITRWYFKEDMQIYTRDLNPHVNDIVPMIIALFVLRVLKPVHMMVLFVSSEMLMRVEPKIFVPMISRLVRLFKPLPTAAPQ